ncbi:MAG: protein translocase subunit SecD [Patescibacteria group bacterium]|nr:protein translocase subunit SecD [Patescibacteria group bacterium]
MNIRKKIWLTFIGIIILAVLAGIVDYPAGPDIKIGSYFKELKIHLGLDLQGGTHLVYQADTSKIEEAEKASALEGVRDVIERRVNTFGVSEPVVQTNKSGDDWRVIVELPGVTEVNQAVEMIGKTPLLEFKKQPPPVELTPEQKQKIEEYNEEAKNKAQEILDQATPENFSTLAKEKSEDPGSQEQGGDLGFFKKGEMVPAFEQAIFEKAKIGQVYPELVETDFGYHIILKTEEKGEGENKEVKASHILIKKKSEADYQTNQGLINTGLSGQQLEKAYLQFNNQTGEAQVALEFNDEGKELFAQITEENIGNIVGIYLDGSPISMPRVNEKIPDGKAVITGEFSVTEAKELAQRLNSGALPVPITLISQQNIGASLGKISVQKSFFAALLGLAFLALFMIIYYRLPGLISVFALAIYTLLVVAIFKLWSITLTLAGVAGFILSIGMAVDANVLIFERIKEELESDKPLNMAIEEGFKRAWLSIRDSNFSSIITCVILAWFGTSLIKGFAITLGVGILISMFSAIIVTRTFLRLIAGNFLEKHPSFLGVKGVKKDDV